MELIVKGIDSLGMLKFNLLDPNFRKEYLQKKKKRILSKIQVHKLNSEARILRTQFDLKIYFFKVSSV